VVSQNAPNEGHGWGETARSLVIALQANWDRTAAGQEYMARWESQPPETLQAPAAALRAGQTAAAISGSLEERGPMATAPMAPSMTFGSSTRPRTIGLGRVAAARCQHNLAAGRGSTALWEQLLRETCREVDPVPRPGLTAAGVCGSLGALASMPAARAATSTISGSSSPP
jgi:hypothetical protein